MIHDGDYLAEEIIIKKYINLIYKKINDFNLKSDYDDVFQECLLVLYNAIEKYKDGPIPFVAFFVRSLNNRLSTIYINKRRNKVFVSDAVCVMMEPSFSISNEFLICDKMFLGLTPLERKLVELRYFENEQVPLIIESYGLKRSSYYYIMRKALDKIRQNINEYDL